jgi:hypothetical protein
METQLKRIREHLNRGKKITPLEALYDYGCFRLGARINDLRREGMDIKTEIIEITSSSVRANKKRVAQYSLNK